MNNACGSRGSLRFLLFGIPTEIQPFSWLLLAVLGLSMYSNSPSPLPSAMIFIVVGMLTLIAHELGHALTARAFTRTTPLIIIGNLGGLTYTPARMPSRASHFLMVFAGPFASFVLGMIAAIALGLQVGDVGAALMIYVMEPLSFITGINVPESAYMPVAEALAEGGINHFALLLYSTFFIVCFWWTVFNLMPILPMDGGHLLLTVTNNPKLTATVGLVLSILLCIWFLTGGSIFMTLMLGYFAWINWQILK